MTKARRTWEFRGGERSLKFLKPRIEAAAINVFRRHSLRPSDDYDLLRDIQQLGLIRAAETLAEKYGDADNVEPAAVQTALTEIIGKSVVHMDGKLIDHLRKQKRERSHREAVTLAASLGSANDAPMLGPDAASRADQPDALAAQQFLGGITCPTEQTIVSLVSEHGYLNQTQLGDAMGMSRKRVARIQAGLIKRWMK